MRANLDPGRHPCQHRINRRRRFPRFTFCGGQSPGDSLAAFGSLNTEILKLLLRQKAIANTSMDLTSSIKRLYGFPSGLCKAKAQVKSMRAARHLCRSLYPWLPLAVQTSSQLLFVLPVFLFALCVAHRQFLSPLARILGPIRRKSIAIMDGEACLAR